jgi:uncharacterized SAM-binding protein YcdF (DUF218 family)
MAFCFAKRLQNSISLLDIEPSVCENGLRVFYFRLMAGCGTMKTGENIKKVKKRSGRSLKRVPPRFFYVVLGAAVMLYFIAVSISWGRIDTFNRVMIAMCAALATLPFAAKPTVEWLRNKLPHAVKAILSKAAFGICVLFVVSLVVIEGFILLNMRETAAAGADYVVVLGCQVDGSVPSVPLRRRVNAAARYLRGNPRAKVVVSGGRGSGEDNTEAAVMKMLLLDYGVDEARILTEEKASSTQENLAFSDRLYHLRNERVVIVTTDYHLFRALSVAKKLRYRYVTGLPSRSHPLSLPAYLLREYTAIVYYKLWGKM